MREPENSEKPLIDGFNSATFDAVLRRLQLHDNEAAAAALNSNAADIVRWRSGAENPPRDVSELALRWATVAQEMTSITANHILENRGEDDNIMIARFRDEAQYAASPNCIIERNGKKTPVPFAVYTAATLDVASTLDSAGIQVRFEYFTEAEAERLRAAYEFDVPTQDAFSTH